MYSCVSVRVWGLRDTAAERKGNALKGSGCVTRTPCPNARLDCLICANSLDSGSCTTNDTSAPPLGWCYRLGGDKLSELSVGVPHRGCLGVGAEG